MRSGCGISTVLIRLHSVFFYEKKRYYWRRDYNKDVQWDTGYSLVLFRESSMSLFIHQSPSQRQTHTPTKGYLHSNKRGKAKKKKKHWESENTTGDSETVRESITLKNNWYESRQMERQRKSVRWPRNETAGVSVGTRPFWPKNWPSPSWTTVDVSLWALLSLHTLYSYPFAALIWSATIWVCLARWVTLRGTQC